MADYYTLTNKGRAWIEDEGPAPKQHTRILASLGEMIFESDTPRTAEQVAHIAETDVASTQAGLSYLATNGFVKVAQPPQPSMKGETSKLRIKSMEELAAAEARAEAARKHYAQSDKGKIAQWNYEHSDKGKAKNDKYWKNPNKGRKVQKRYRLNRRIRELEDHLKKHPEMRDVLTKEIEDAKRRLAELDKEGE